MEDTPLLEKEFTAWLKENFPIYMPHMGEPEEYAHLRRIMYQAFLGGYDDGAFGCGL